MSELVESQITEESAPVTETEVHEQKDIAENWTPTQIAKARQAYMRRRKEEIEVLEVDVKFQDLQIKHHYNSMEIAKINEELQEIKRKAESEDFKKKLAV